MRQTVSKVSAVVGGRPGQTRLRRPFSPQLLVPVKIAKLPLQRRTSPSPWGPEDVGVKSGHSRHLR